MQRLDLRGRSLSLRELREGLPRAQFDVDAALYSVEPICAEVRAGGGDALRDLAERYDGVCPPRLRVPDHVVRGEVRLTRRLTTRPLRREEANGAVEGHGSE